MPIQIPADLPARSALESENIFVMTDERAVRQDIRPLDIVIVNLMPTKIATETQLLRLLGNSPLQVNITLLRTAEHQSKNTPLQHLERFYKTFSEIRHRSFDGMIVTGAPVEHLPFEQVDYWQELLDIMTYANGHVFSTLYICWAAQAALYHFYGVPKYELPERRSGIFRHQVLHPDCRLFRGFDDDFPAPHSRHTEVRAARRAPDAQPAHPGRIRRGGPDPGGEPGSLPGLHDRSSGIRPRDPGRGIPPGPGPRHEPPCAQPLLSQ